MQHWQIDLQLDTNFTDARKLKQFQVHSQDSKVFYWLQDIHCGLPVSLFSVTTHFQTFHMRFCFTKGTLAHT